ncbi:GNAT family N-acetyltransferase [Leifsonia sp. 2MCAF36]|uniref:GNAT family N-acetyltransferase n=1 Tax=Leifsonia sp. 2MCAF36 TaxID=3232988 RepID=UPI003F977446
MARRSEAAALRVGTSLDVDACVQLWIDSVSARDRRPAPASVAERARGKFQHAQVAFAVADDGDDVAGFALVTGPGSGSPLDPPDAAYLAMIAVSPKLQGAGLGSLLLEDVVQGARAAGHRAIVLHVLTSNRRAVALYSSRGWHPLGDASSHPISGAPILTLERRLFGSPEDTPAGTPC